MVRSVAELPQRINEAFEIAMSGRPGPVLVDLPKDVTASRLSVMPSLEPDIPALRTKSFVRRACLSVDMIDAV
jgi:acetolactate synthase-1/2/3 large subunit